jgi:hypothetical protein
MKKVILILVIVFSFISSTKGQQAEQQPINTEGKEFWLAFMGKFEYQSLTKLKVYITSKNNTNGTISIPLGGWTQNFNVRANEGIVIEVPMNSGMSDRSEFIEPKGIHIVSDNNIRVWAVNNANYSTDGTSVLSTESIGEAPEYIVASYFGLQNFVSTEFIIVSTEDGTQISITPTANTLNGRPANVTFNIYLNKGET